MRRGEVVIGIVVISVAICVTIGHLAAQDPARPTAPIAREAVIYLKNKSFDDSEAARQAILAKYKGLRVADVSDAMDQVGLPDIGVMADYMKPLWRDTAEYSHVICGFAFTVRYLPSDEPRPTPAPDDYRALQNRWYGQLSGSYWKSELRAGDLVVMDANETNAGVMGSNNSMEWWINGAVGVITNDGPRDTDELIAMKYPVYCRKANYGTNIARGKLESWNRPINCAGVLVYPGDVVVADGDGVIVIPREKAIEVAQIARNIYEADEKSRAAKYDKLRLDKDERVK